MSKYNTDINIEGKNIRNYFQNMISDKEPNLILKNKINNIDSYSRVCQSNQRRQPVILTKNEYGKVISKYPEYVDDEKHIKYGTDKNNQYYYICPKYWNLKTDLPITETEMKDNDLYKYIIPRNSNYVPKDKFIYEFTNKNGDNHPYPNFITNRHPDGHCLPCCFKFGLDTLKHKKVKEKCTAPNTEENNTNGELDYKSNQNIDYIINSDKFPIDQNRKGFLPISLQKIFEHDNKTCQVSTTNVSLKLDHDCLLRRGIIYNNKQSFLECISDIMGFGMTDLKDYMMEYLTIDKFSQLQNGNLINAFYDPSPSSSHEIPLKEMNMYKKSKLYKILNMDDIIFETNHQKIYQYNALFFKKVCISFKNFKTFLMSTDSYIDYTYTWDLITEICSITLCIFEIHQTDLGNELVDILCPSNVYSKYTITTGYDNIACIIKKDNLYEPIYLFNQTKTKTNIIKLFNKKTPRSIPIIKILKRIITFMRTYCGNISDKIDGQYPSNKLFTLSELIQKIMIPKQNHVYTILQKIMNYSGKIIGLHVELSSTNLITNTPYTMTGIITCIPTTLIDTITIPGVTNKTKDIENIPTTMVTDPLIWSTLKETLGFYRNVHILKISQQLKNTLINDRGYIIGFVTESEQLIEITDKNTHLFTNKKDVLYKYYKDYAPYTWKYPLYEDDQLISLIANTDNGIDGNFKNYINKHDIDTERTRIYNNITIESAQYSFFRNIIKIRLSNHTQIKKRIETIIHNKLDSSENKNIEKIIHELKKLLHNKVKFVDSLPANHIELLMMTDIMNNNPISLVKYNHNNEIYYDRIAGEILYNNRMRNYILDSSRNIALYKTTYDVLKNQEVILTETMINDYYNKLERTLTYPNKYNFHDMVDKVDVDKYPIIDDSYSFYKNTYMVPNTNCNNIIPRINSDVPKYLKTYMNNSNLQIVTYKKESGYCNIITLLESHKREYKSIQEIKDDLIRLYMDIITKESNQSPKSDTPLNIIYKILTLEGKKELVDELKTDVNLSILTLINENHYWLTALDYWLLLNYYGIPCLVQYKKTSDNAIWTVTNKENMPTTFSYIIGYGYNKSNKDTTQDGVSFVIKENNYLINVVDFKPKYQDILNRLYDDQKKIRNIIDVLHIFLNTKKIYID